MMRKKRAAPSADYRYIDIVSEHPWQGGEAEEGRRRWVNEIRISWGGGGELWERRIRKEAVS